MSRAPQLFRQVDLAKAIKAVLASGREVARVEVTKDGRIIVIVAGGKEEPAGKPGCSNEWDDLSD
jgi:hypothetical protein